MAFTPDIDPQETQEWLEAIDAVLANEGTERAHYLLETLIDKALRRIPSIQRNNCVCEYHSYAFTTTSSRQPRYGTPHSCAHPLERNHDCASRK